MTPETKFRELERRAMVHLTRPLDAPEFGDSIHASVIVLIWRYAAFGPYQSWSLILDRAAGKEHWLIRRTTWERSIDYQRAADPLKQAAFMIDRDPALTIEILNVNANADFATQFIERLRVLSVPSLLGPDWIGLDGVANGIETKHGQVRLEWWCDGPPAWRVLAEEVERLRLDLDAAVSV